MSRVAPLPVALGALLLMGSLAGTTLANDGTPGSVPELVDPPNALPLEGTEWRLVKAQLSGAYADIPAEVEATLLMQDGQAGGSGGCNQWSTTYVLDGANLTFSDQITMTLMMCVGPGGDVETFYLADLPGITDWAIDGDTLTLSNETGPVLAFRPQAESGPSVEGDWIITQYNDGQGALVAIRDGSAQLTIADGHVSGTAGCNRFMGSVSQVGAAITVSQLGSTEMYCEGLMDREAAVMASLMASATAAADGDGLVLLDAAGTVQLRLVPATPTVSPASSGSPADPDAPVTSPAG